MLDQHFYLCILEFCVTSLTTLFSIRFLEKMFNILVLVRLQMKTHCLSRQNILTFAAHISIRQMLSVLSVAFQC